MEKRIDQKKLQAMREEFEPGTVIVLDKMEDPYRSIPIGTKGVVSHVDDIGTIHAKWENGVQLGLVYGVDYCHVDSSKG